MIYVLLFRHGLRTIRPAFGTRLLLLRRIEWNMRYVLIYILMDYKMIEPMSGYLLTWILIRLFVASRHYFESFSLKAQGIRICTSSEALVSCIAVFTILSARLYASPNTYIRCPIAFARNTIASHTCGSSYSNTLCAQNEVGHPRPTNLRRNPLQMARQAMVSCHFLRRSFFSVLASSCLY